MKNKKLRLFVDKLNIYLCCANDFDIVSKENDNSIEQYNLYFKDEAILNNDILEFKGKEVNFKFNIDDIEEFKIDFGGYEVDTDEFYIKYKGYIYRFTFENTLFIN